MFSSWNMVFKSSVVMLFALFFLTIFSHNGLIDYIKLCKAKQVILSDNQSIKKKNLDFSRQINRLTNDDKYIEHIAKHEFGMAGPDEYVFRTIPGRKAVSGINTGADKP